MALFTGLSEELESVSCIGCGASLPRLASQDRCRRCREEEDRRVIALWDELPPSSESKREVLADIRRAVADGGWGWEE